MSRRFWTGVGLAALLATPSLATSAPDPAWPAGLRGPFERQAPEHVRVRSFDGVELDGWIQRPVLPPGVRAPVVLASGPYFGQEERTGDYDELDAPRWLVDEGYAVAAFNVRGTGNSGGCFEFFGPAEQRDQAVLVEWLGSRPWSNGRVGMYGLSYLGTTPWEAAIQNPKHLKAIVTAGMVADPYNFFYSPQGATMTIGAGFGTAYVGRVSGNAPVFGGPQHAILDHLPVVPDRACPEIVDFLANLYTGSVTDDRGERFWKPRRLSTRFGDVRAAAFVVHGFQDLWTSGHAFQEDYAWRMLRRAPKRMLEGQWAHEFPPLGTWHATVSGWFDHWLKGIGRRAPGEGTVDYADGAGRWRRATSWPPAHRDEVLHFNESHDLTPGRGGFGGSIVSAPATVTPDNGRAPELLCPADAPFVPSRQQVFTTKPVTKPVHLAGNAFAYLQLISSRPGGLVVVHLADLSPEFHCVGNQPFGARMVTYGSADLRFHSGGYAGKPFPVGARTWVRIDIASFAETLEPGHRLAAVVSAGDVVDRMSAPEAALVSLEPASHLVLPLVAGTLGGAKPRLAYPRNPFPGWLP